MPSKPPDYGRSERFSCADPDIHDDCIEHPPAQSAQRGSEVSVTAVINASQSRGLTDMQMAAFSGFLVGTGIPADLVGN